LRRAAADAAARESTISRDLADLAAELEAEQRATMQAHPG
jgi:hypothetical protein